MASPSPKTNPAEFGSFPNYLAGRVGGFRATRELSRNEMTGKSAAAKKGADGGEKAVTAEKAGKAANLNMAANASSRPASWALTSGQAGVPGD